MSYNTSGVLDAVEYPELDTVMYLTGVSTEQTRQHAGDELGYMVTPASDPSGLQVPFYRYFGADNGGYALRGRPFDGDAWLAWLDKLDRQRALFAALPDVLHWLRDPETGVEYPVGDFEATLERSAKYVDDVKTLGFPAALVAQDGMTDLDQVPFPVDALFVGGSNDFKLGPDVRHLTKQARERGLWVHFGRVNSGKRLRYASEVGADSADGTFMKYTSKAGQQEQFERMMRWFDVAGRKPSVDQLVG